MDRGELLNVSRRGRQLGMMSGNLHNAIAVLLGALVVTVTVAGCAAGTGAVVPIDDNVGRSAGAQRVVGSGAFELSYRSDKDVTRRAAYGYRAGEQMLVTGTYEEDSVAARRVLEGKSRTPGYWDLQVDSSLGLDGTKARVEFASNSHNPLPGTRPGQAEASSLFRFGVQRSWHSLAYGLNYQSVGKHFARPGDSKSTVQTDREGSELWGRWQFGNVRIKPSVSQFHDNIEEEPDRPRLTDTRAGITLEHTLLSWPYLGYSVSYSSGTRRSSEEPGEFESYRGLVNTAELSVKYSAEQWSASLYSSRSGSENSRALGAAESSTLTHYLSGSYYPNGAIGIAGTMGHINENYGSEETATISNEASLSLTYRPSLSHTSRNLYASFASSKNPTWQLDTRYFSAGVGQEWYLRNKRSVISVVSLDVNYSHYLDDTSPAAITDDLSVWLKFNHSFGARPILVQRARGFAALVPADAGPDKSATSRRSSPRTRGDTQDVAQDSLSTAAWLDSQDPAHYTIQLSSSRREQSARDFLRQNHLDSRAVYAAVESEGATWYAVFYGAYSSRAAAVAAVKALPADLQAGGPWVRSINTVQAQAASSHRHWAKLEPGILPSDRDPTSSVLR